MLKFIVVLYRKPGLSPDEFFSNLRNEHGPMAERIPGLRRYVQNHVVPDPKRKHPGWDAVVELYWDDWTAMEVGWATPEGKCATDHLETLGWTTAMSTVLRTGAPSRYAEKILADQRLTAALSDAGLSSLQKLAAARENPNAKESPRLAERFEEYLTTIARNTQFALSNDLVVAVGSDCPPGYGTHLEIELLRDTGLDAATILRAATLGGAKALGLSDRYGTIEPGKVADLVVLYSDPLDEITNLRDVSLVLKGGYVWRSTDLLSENR